LAVFLTVSKDFSFYTHNLRNESVPLIKRKQRKGTYSLGPAGNSCFGLLLKLFQKIKIQ
jgi:hypothetical protein